MQETYKIFQIKDIENCPYAFRDYDFAKDHGFTLDDYHEVYSRHLHLEEPTSDEIICETIYDVFNMRKPEDFTGHSISVSDCIMIDNNIYYCDNGYCGWKKVN